MGYLASRIPVQVLLHLRHPEAKDPSAEHPWCAWDICEGGLHVPGFSSPYPEPCPISSPLLRGSVIDEAPGYSCLDFWCGASKISGLGCSGRTVLWEWGDGDWARLTTSLPTILFSLQPGQRSVVTRQLRQPGMMCTEQPTASYGWHWTAASACVFIPRATVSRKVRQPVFLCCNVGKRVWAL